MNIVKQDNVIREIKSLPRVEKDGTTSRKRTHKIDKF